jgi:hypothetical protein
MMFDIATALPIPVYASSPQRAGEIDPEVAELSGLAARQPADQRDRHSHADGH